MVKFLSIFYHIKTFFKIILSLVGHRSSYFSKNYFFFFFGETVAWACKEGTLLYPFSHTSSPFCSLFYFILFFWYWGLNSGPTPWPTPPAFFCNGFFWHRLLRTICLGWLRTAILLIYVSWVTRITGMSH
jgi:hypothetical protein